MWGGLTCATTSTARSHHNPGGVAAAAKQGSSTAALPSVSTALHSVASVRAEAGPRPSAVLSGGEREGTAACPGLDVHEFVAGYQPGTFGVVTPKIVRDSFPCRGLSDNTCTAMATAKQAEEGGLYRSDGEGRVHSVLCAKSHSPWQRQPCCHACFALVRLFTTKRGSGRRRGLVASVSSSLLCQPVGEEAQGQRVPNSASELVARGHAAQEDARMP